MLRSIVIELYIIVETLSLAIASFDPLRESITPKHFQAISIRGNTTFFGISCNGHSDSQWPDLLIGDFPGPVVGGVEVGNKQKSKPGD